LPSSSFVVSVDRRGGQLIASASAHSVIRLELPIGTRRLSAVVESPSIRFGQDYVG